MESIWSKSRNSNSKELQGDISTEVAIIGGGIAGILTSYMLKKKGVPSIIIEAGQIEGGVTENTTAKITCQHSLIYAGLVKKFGQEKALQYAKMNRDALQMYRDIMAEERIERLCSFETIPSYLYTTQSRGTELLQNEHKAMSLLGFRGTLEDKSALPFNVKASLKMDEQAQFNPMEFLSHIAKGLAYYENTQALGVEGENVITKNGGKVNAKKIIVTTHFPFINIPGYYFMRMHQERSYVIALANAEKTGPFPHGAYLGIDDEKYSFRSYGDTLLFGGGGHRTGDNEIAGMLRYEKLSELAKTFYPQSREICRWSAQDCMTHDGVPLIGKYSEETDNLFVATGFNKWGMTSSMAAAMILSDMIVGRENTCGEVFSPQRHNIKASVKKLIKDGYESVSGLLQQALLIPPEKLRQIELGHGGIVKLGRVKVGVYKKSLNEIHIVDTKCPHLGCQLSWNPDELSWDCPCHGSRFSYLGELIDNPSQKGLRHEELSFEKAFKEQTIL